MSLLNHVAKIAISVTALPLVAMKDVIDHIDLCENLPHTADLVHDIFDNMDDMFQGVDNAIDNSL